MPERRRADLVALEAALVAALDRYESADRERREALDRNAAEYSRITREVSKPQKDRMLACRDVQELAETIQSLGDTLPQGIVARVGATQKSTYESDEWKAATVRAGVPVPVTYETDEDL